MQFLAKDYATRSDLENAVRSKLGLTVDVKAAVIQGTEADLARLQLSARTVFWGVSCEVLNPTPEPKKKAKAPDRGKVHKSGINLKK